MMKAEFFTGIIGVKDWSFLRLQSYGLSGLLDRMHMRLLNLIHSPRIGEPSTQLKENILGITIVTEAN